MSCRPQLRPHPPHYGKATPRVPVASARYSGPRLPSRLQVRGQYVLQIPGTSTVIDGNGENSPPFEHARSPGIYANHSSAANARVETWPVLRPEPYGVRQHVMLVASEQIDAGHEVRTNASQTCPRLARALTGTALLFGRTSPPHFPGRPCGHQVRIDYEDGGECNYWGGKAPPETEWRRVRVCPPPPSLDEPVCNWLQELQAAASRREVLPVPMPSPLLDATPWEGAAGGDARLRAIVPLLACNGDVSRIWPLVSTHVPGRSGLECKRRWALTWRDAGGRYCTCGGPSFGDMVGIKTVQLYAPPPILHHYFSCITPNPQVGCDNPECAVEWFHFGCVGITASPKGEWLCESCAVLSHTRPRGSTQSGTF